MAATYITISDLCLLNPLLSGDKEYSCIKDQLYLTRKKGRDIWISIGQKDGGSKTVQIDYDTIPDKFKEKYSLPIEYADAKRIIDALNKEQASPVPVKVAATPAENEALYMGMLQAVNKRKTACHNAIKARYPEITDVNRVAQYARRMAAMEYIEENYRRWERGELQQYFAAYCRVCPGHINTEKPTAYFTFSNVVNKIMKPDADIMALAVDMKSVVKVKPRTDPLVITELQRLFVCGMYRCAAAYRKLVAVCAEAKIPCPKQSTIKSLWAAMKQEPNLIGERYGDAARRKTEGYVSQERAAHRNEQWQADGKVLPFFVKDKDGKGVRWTVFLVMDNHSRKIVGYALGARENTELIMEGLEEAVRKTGVWPTELVTDKHSYTRTESAAILREYVENIGGRIIDSINPQTKAVVERYNQYLDDIWREYPHWLGKGLKSKNPDNRPGDDALEEAYKPANYKTPDEIKAIVVSSIEQYNNTQLTVLEGKTPNEAYEAATSLAYNITDAERPIMFHRDHTYKVDRCRIKIVLRKKKHEFLLPAKLVDKYNNRVVVVRYEDLTQGIYLYDVRTGEALGIAYPVKKVNSVYSHQTAEEKAEVHKVTGRKKGAVNRGEKRVQDIKDKTILANPDLAEMLDGRKMPKNIKAELQSSPATKREYAIQGGNANMIPDRKETKETAIVQRKKTPFQQPPTTGKLEKFNPWEYLDN